MEFTLLAISTIIFTAYVVFIAVRYGVQKSISESYYRLVEDPLMTKNLFVLALFGFATPIFFLAQSILLPLAAGFICFVGVAAAFKERKQTKVIHMVGAFGGILFGLTSLILDFGQWPLVIEAAILAILLRLFVKNSIWWIEILAFITILLGIAIS